MSKERVEKEKAIKDKELMQKQIDEMQAQLELAKANFGDVVQNPICTAARKVHSLPLENGFH